VVNPGLRNGGKWRAPARSVDGLGTTDNEMHCPDLCSVAYVSVELDVWLTSVSSNKRAGPGGRNFPSSGDGTRTKTSATSAERQKWVRSGWDVIRMFLRHEQCYWQDFQGRPKGRRDRGANSGSWRMTIFLSRLESRRLYGVPKKAEREHSGRRSRWLLEGTWRRCFASVKTLIYGPGWSCRKGWRIHGHSGAV